MSKNTSGLKAELNSSRLFHQDSVPILISAQILRSRLLGQVDLARTIKIKGEWRIEIAEVKSSEIGAANLSFSQKQRLLGSARFLSMLMGRPSRLIKLVG